MIPWNNECPVKHCRSKRECIGSGVEDAEPGSVLGRSMLARWRKESLYTSLVGLRPATMVRVVEVHDSPDLQMINACTRLCCERSRFGLPKRWLGTEVE